MFKVYKVLSGEECLTRFRNSEGFAAELFYPVEE